jgi:hypothetical protein
VDLCGRGAANEGRTREDLPALMKE